jgi:hypothetical protein
LRGLFRPSAQRLVAVGVRQGSLCRGEAEQGFIAPPEYGQARDMLAPFTFRMTA